MGLLVLPFKTIFSDVRRHAEYLEEDEIGETGSMGSYKFIHVDLPNLPSAHFLNYGIGWREVAWPSILYLALA